MANPVIATVQSVTAPITVRDEDGALRQLNAGDSLRLGDVVLTENGQSANLRMTDGSVVTLTGAKETLISNDLMAATASSADEAAISEASLDQLINDVRDQVATSTPGADQILAALQGDGALDDLLEETAAGLTGEGEGEGHSFVLLDRIDEQVELALTTTTPFNASEEQEPIEGVQQASLTLATESDDGSNIAQFTDNFVNGVSYSTSSGLTGLTGDAGAPGSFRYNDGDTLTFSIGAVTIAEFSADLIQGPYLFIQDLKGLSLSETNDQFVENVAIFLQALDSDLDDGNDQEGLQTQDISREEAGLAFSNNIEITAEIRTLFENYVDPATGQPLNLMDSGKGQISDALSKAGVEFTAKSEMEGVSYDVNSANGGTVVIDQDGYFIFTPNGEASGEQTFTYTVTNNSGDAFEMTRVVNLSDAASLTGSVRMNSFEMLAMQHVQETISELAGDRAPEAMDTRSEDTWGEFEEGTESDRVVNYNTAPDVLEVNDSGIQFVVDASMLAYGYVPKQINDDSMMNNMDLSDVSVRLLDNDGEPISNRSLSIEFDAESKTGVVTLSADDETSLDELAAEVAGGLLENLAFDYTIWDWTVPVKVEGAGAIDAYKSHLSANPADVEEDGVYSQFVVNSTLAFDEAQKLTVKFSPEGSGTDFAEYSDDFSVPIQYRNGDGDWVDMQVLDETYTRADYDKPLPIFEFELAAGSTAVEIRIPLFDDPYIENTEIIDMLVEGDNFYSENIQPKIKDNDSENNTPIVEVNFAVVSEDDGYATLTFSLVDQNGNLITDTADTTITYQTADLSAKAGLDYTAIPNDGDTGTAVIEAGKSTTSFQIPIIDDSIIEQTEFFKVDVLSVSDNAVLGDPEASVRIYDNDGMTITGDAQQEGTNITYTVVLSSDLPSSEKTITLTPTNSGATASKGDDYSSAPVTLTYVDGDSIIQTILANSDGSFTLPEAVSTFQASYSTVVDNTPDGGADTPRDEVARLQVQVQYPSGDETLTVTGLGEATILDANSPVADTVENTGEEDAASISITLKGSDIDLNDRVETFTLSNLPANGVLYTDAALTTLATIDTIYSATNEELTLYFAPNENWNGETSFDYTASDGELESETATATVNVTAVNDQPTIAGDDSGTVTEDAATPNLTDTGTLTISDDDTGEAVFQTTGITASTGALGGLSITSAGAWTYSVANADVQYLAKDQEKVETFTVLSADGTGHDITITIIGTNDAPTVTSNSQRSFSSSDSNFQAEERVLINGFTISAGKYQGDTPTGELESKLMTKAGSGIGVQGGSNEIDVTQKEYIQVDFGANVSTAELTLGSLADHYNKDASQDAQINVVLFKNGGQVGGVQSFDADYNTLSIDNKIATLTIRSDSGDFDTVRVFTTQGEPGGVESQNSNFILLGGSASTINVVEGSVTEIPDGSTGENTDGLIANGSFGIADVDLADVQTVTITEANTTGSSVLGTLTAEISNNTTNDGIGSVSWSYSVPDAAVDYLAEGETVKETFTVEVSDQKGGTVTQDVTITINGTNDAPTLSSGRVVLSETFERTEGFDIESRPNGWYVEKGSMGSSGSTFKGSNGAIWTVDAAGVEIQGNVGDSSAYEGSQHAELDSHGNPSDVKLSTTVNVQESENLSLTFAYKPRPSAEDSSDMKVTLGGKGVIILSDSDGVISFESEGVETTQSDAGNGWTLITLNYPSSAAGNVELKFEGLEPEEVQDTLGAYIDDIQLVANTISNASITEIEDGNPNENVATHTARGQIAFEDVDVTDVHDLTVSAEVKDENGVVIASPLGSLTLSDATDNTDGTAIWTFSVNDSDIDYLAEGQSLTQIYTVTVDDENGGTVDQNITVVIKGTNDAPLITVTANDFTEDAGGLVAGTSVAGTYTTSDEDGDTLTVTFNTLSSHYTLGTGADAGKVFLTQAGIDVINAGGDLDAIDLKVTDGSLDGTDSDTPTITEVNDALTLVMAAPASFTEDTASAGNAVTSVTSVNDPDGGDVTYSISDTTNYAIDANTGAVTLTAAGAALVNVDSGASLPEFTVTATSAGTYGSSGTAIMTPAVSEVNDALTLVMAAPASFTEDTASAGDAVTSVTSVNDTDGGAVTYSISDTTNYAIDANTGAVTLTAAGAALVNVDSGASLPEFTVTATSAGTYGSSGTATMTPAVTGVNDALTLVMAAPASFIEDTASAGDAVTSVTSVTDPDGGAVTYSISDTTNYAIDANTGAVTLTAAGAALVNVDAGASLPEFTVTATSAGTYGSSDTATMTPTITEVNDALTLVMAAPASFTEDTASAGNAVTSVTSVNDPDGGAVTYSISDTTNYAINISTGAVTLTAAGAALVNVDAGASLPKFTVTATSAGTYASSDTATMTPAVTEVNDAPTVTSSLNSIHITAANATDTENGFRVTAHDIDGNVVDIGAKGSDGDNVYGFGVNADASGADVELGESGGKSESLQVTFDDPVNNAKVSFSWKSSTESAKYELFDGEVLVGQGVHEGGSDRIDPAITLTADEEVKFDRIVFSAPTDNVRTNDDFLINSIMTNYVFEAGLDTGSNVGPTVTTLTGTFILDDPDGLNDIESIKIDDVTFTVAQLNGATNDSPLQVTGDKGTLSITNYTDGVATYSYTLTSAVDDDTEASQEVFSVTTSDGTLSSDPASITINISDDGPSAVEDVTNTAEETAVTFNVMDNDDKGADGATLTAAALATGSAGAGTVSIDANGNVTFDPATGFAGYAVIDYTITDADGDTSSATLTVVVPSIIVTGGGDVNEGSDAVFTVELTHPMDVDHDLTIAPSTDDDNTAEADDIGAMTVTYVDSENQTQTIDANSNGTYTVPAGVTSLSVVVTTTANDVYEGPETFTLTASSSLVGSGTGAATILDDETIANVAPTTIDGSVSGSEDAVISVPTLSGSDSDGSVASFVIRSLPADGTLFVNGTEVTATGVSVSLDNADKLTFEPVENWNGSSSFTYSAIDDDGAADATPATMSIAVTPTSDIYSQMDIETGKGVPVSGGISDLSGADGKTTFYSGGITLTASEGMNFNSGNGLGVGPSNSFRISGNDTVTVEYDSPLTINQVNLWVKNSVEEDVQISATINIDEKEYTVQATAREAGDGGNALSYLTTLKLINSAGDQVGNEVISTISNSQLTLNSMIGEKSYTFSITPSFTSGNDDDTIVFESSVAFSQYVISDGPDGKGKGFTIGQIGTDTSTPLFYEYPVALEALSTDDSGNDESLNSSFTIGGLKTGDSIVFGDTIFEAGDDGTITINSADLFNEISSDSDELTLRSSEELPEGYKLSLTVSSTENGKVMITSKGGSADDSFTGGDYADLLSGGAGNDTLTGGLGEDVFAWNLSDADGGNDTITDFGTGDDVIDISDLLTDTTGLDALLSAGDISVAESNGNTIISVAASNGVSQDITLKGVTVDQITSGDYVSYNESNDLGNVINDLINSGKLITD